MEEKLHPINLFLQVKPHDLFNVTRPVHVPVPVQLYTFNLLCEQQLVTFTPFSCLL